MCDHNFDYGVKVEAADRQCVFTAYLNNAFLWAPFSLRLTAACCWHNSCDIFVKVNIPSVFCSVGPSARHLTFTIVAYVSALAAGRTRSR